MIVNCQCGKRTELSPRTLKFACRCGKIYKERSLSVIARGERVKTAIEREAALVRSLRLRLKPAEGIGDACNRFFALADRYRSPLAERLGCMLQACDCDRQTAISRINQRFGGSFLGE